MTGRENLGVRAAIPSIRVIDSPGRIVSKGLNAAIRAARGDIIIRMDVHCEYEPGYIQQCLQVLETGAAARWRPTG